MAIVQNVQLRAAMHNLSMAASASVRVDISVQN